MKTLVDLSELAGSALVVDAAKVSGVWHNKANDEVFILGMDGPIAMIKEADADIYNRVVGQLAGSGTGLYLVSFDVKNGQGILQDVYFSPAAVSHLSLSTADEAGQRTLAFGICGFAAVLQAPYGFPEIILREIMQTATEQGVSFHRIDAKDAYAIYTRERMGETLINPAAISVIYDYGVALNVSFKGSSRILELQTDTNGGLSPEARDDFIAQQAFDYKGPRRDFVDQMRRAFLERDVKRRRSLAAELAAKNPALINAGAGAENALYLLPEKLARVDGPYEFTVEDPGFGPKKPQHYYGLQIVEAADRYPRGFHVYFKEVSLRDQALAALAKMTAVKPQNPDKKPQDPRP